MKLWHTCGTEWIQDDNETGHCSQCHETFDSLDAFDSHQVIRKQKLICRKPAKLGLKSRTDEYTTYWSERSL